MRIEKQALTIVTIVNLGMISLGCEPTSAPQLERSALDVFRIEREGENAAFRRKSKTGNTPKLELRRGPTTNAERSAIEALRPKFNEKAAQSKATVLDRGLKKLNARPVTELVRVRIQLREKLQGIGQLRGLKGAQRAAVLKGLEQQAQAQLGQAIDQLSALGALDIQHRWLSQTLWAQIPSGAAKRIAALPSVEALGLVERVAQKGNGQVNRQALLTDTILPSYEGDRAGRGTSGRVRIAVIESIWNGGQFQADNWPAHNHVGFLDQAGRSRIIEMHDCSDTVLNSPARCTQVSSPTVGASSHGTAVSWVAAGSIDRGQDPVYPGQWTDAQAQRSGHAAGAEIVYYQIYRANEVALAIERAVENGVDIINMSFTLEENGRCDRTANDFNRELRGAFEAGVLVVAASGNTSGESGCTVEYPSFRPEVIGVNWTSGTGNYNRSPMDSDAPRGGLSIRTRGGQTTLVAGVDLTTMGSVSSAFSQAPNSYDSSSRRGSSFATPAVSGTAALLKSALADQFGAAFANDPGYLMANLFLMGDTWGGVAVTQHLPDWDGDMYAANLSGISHISGYGRLKAHIWNAEHFPGPSGWGMRSFVIHPNETVRWTVGSSGPEPESVHHWKGVLTYLPEDLSAVEEVHFMVFDTCGPEGDTLVAADVRADWRKRVALHFADISERCLEMRAVGTSALPTAGIQVWTADYYHSGHLNDH